MRSGPSMAATLCRTRRQRKRKGGPSGTSARASIGSGWAKRRNGRAGAPLDRLGLSPRAALPPSGGRGRLGLFGQMRLDELATRHRAGPEPRAQSVEKLGERKGALGLVRALDSASEGASGSALRQARRMRSTP